MMLTCARTLMKMAQVVVALSLVFVLVMSLVCPYSHSDSNLTEESLRMEQFGGGGSLEDQCGSITFEDMFEYTNAEFVFDVNPNWQTAEVRAVAWINESLADDIRTTMDEFMAEIDPNDGGDGWLSTDEREIFRALASECIEHTLTRIGIRDGDYHRGGDGVSWKNTSWEEDGVEIQEFNIVPPRHSEIRECTSAFGNECEEIPVIPDDNRDCDTDIPSSDGIDECRVQLWLNATMTIPGVANGNQFTLVLNASNMTRSSLEFNFPVTPDLRLDMWEECEGRDVSFEEESPIPAPIRGTCLGDGSSSHTLEELSDGRLRFTILPDTEIEDWPLGEDLFADFTTAPIPVDEPPEWTVDAPVDSAWFPSPSGGQHIWAGWDDISSWFTDEGSVTQLDIRCSGADSLQLSEGADRSLWAEIPRGSPGEVTCEAVDSAGQSSGQRTWNLGVPFSISTTQATLSEPHPISITPTSQWPALQLDLALIQNGQASTPTSITFGEEVVVDLAASNMVPGEVDVWVRIQGSSNVYTMEHIYDIDLTKESSPPMLTITNSDWDGAEWSMQGQYSDPDGEEVSFSMTIAGSNTGSVSSTGNSWSTPAIDFRLWSEGEHVVSVEGCDSSGKCSEVFQTVNNSHLFEVEEVVPPPSEEEDGGLLPAAGLPMVLVAVVAALMYGRRRA